MRFQAVSGQAISGQEGSGLILILVLLSIASITMMGAMTIGGVQQKTRTQSILPYHVQLMRGNIANILRRPLNWSQTASDSGNPSMACISGSSTCPTATPQPIYVIKTAADTGTSYTYKVGGTNGITPSGQACVGYPSETCPISFDVRWTCDANCANPATRTFSVSVTPAYNPAVGTGTSKTLIAFDASKYVINFPLSSTTSYFYKP
ncbi:MAG: hypothetical protein ACJ763_02465 [Bdellovibrionia bacterium]